MKVFLAVAAILVCWAAYNFIRGFASEMKADSDFQQVWVTIRELLRRRS